MQKQQPDGHRHTQGISDASVWKSPRGDEVFVCKEDLECPGDKDFDEHYHSFEKCVVCGRMTTCAECLCGTGRL